MSGRPHASPSIRTVNGDTPSVPARAVPWAQGQGVGAELSEVIARHGASAGAVLRAMARAARTAGDVRRLARYRRMALVAEAMLPGDPFVPAPGVEDRTVQ